MPQIMSRDVLGLRKDATVLKMPTSLKCKYMVYIICLSLSSSYLAVGFENCPHDRLQFTEGLA